MMIIIITAEAERKERLSHLPVLVFVYQTWHQAPGVCRCTDQQKDH